MDFGGGIGHHHRLRRVGGSRGAYRADRLGDRFQPWPAVPARQPHADAACGLRRFSRHSRHLQDSDSRSGVHDRGADD